MLFKRFFGLLTPNLKMINKTLDKILLILGQYGDYNVKILASRTGVCFYDSSGDVYDSGMDDRIVLERIIQSDLKKYPVIQFSIKPITPDPKHRSEWIDLSFERDGKYLQLYSQDTIYNLNEEIRCLRN